MAMGLARLRNIRSPWNGGSDRLRSVGFDILDLVKSRLEAVAPI